jgi:hypothetical protein
MANGTIVGIGNCGQACVSVGTINARPVAPPSSST